VVTRSPAGPPPQDHALTLFAVTAPGLESITALELRQLGIPGARVEPGGVEFEGDWTTMARANLWLRTASRVLVRFGSFHVRALGELERRASRLLWDRYVASGRRVSLRVSSKKSRLYHQRAIAERIACVVDATGGVPEQRAGDDEVETPSQLVVVRLLRDECLISIDSSGDLLHRRGYRQAVAKAPLRETLAAALLLASQWDATRPLIDPFCGSGTIPIEAALLGRRIPPGVHREFAFQRWPGYDASRWDGLVALARDQMLARSPAPIAGSDRDAGAIEAAIANATRAGVLGDIVFHQGAISGLVPFPEPGWIVTNPPYGIRIGERRGLRDLYARFGKVLQRKCAGWRLAMLAGPGGLERELRAPLTPLFTTTNGGVRVRGFQLRQFQI
jgi:putative N6-adenine-specific DNA methylase